MKNLIKIVCHILLAMLIIGSAQAAMFWDPTRTVSIKNCLPRDGIIVAGYDCDDNSFALPYAASEPRKLEHGQSTSLKCKCAHDSGCRFTINQGPNMMLKGGPQKTIYVEKDQALSFNTADCSKTSN